MLLLPAYIPLTFLATVGLTILLFYLASKKSYPFILIVLFILGFQSSLAMNTFFQDTTSLPPRFLVLPAPSLFLIILLFFTRMGRQFLDNLDTGLLTLLHTIRIPVELVLYWLFLNQAIPEVMTFEGRNFDILAGISAPFVYYLAYQKKILSRSFLIGWNLICLGLLANIVAHAVLAAPSPIQQIAFEQPNIAILHFPFVLLPGIVVPLVLVSHLATLRKLVR
ncbi:MAG TPA: hypothetical protein PKY12_14550 [Catalimonadaceae bacterium]|nr:hypothetical protein [Catalimonadaceae bacterium]